MLGAGRGEAGVGDGGLDMEGVVARDAIGGWDAWRIEEEPTGVPAMEEVDRGSGKFAKDAVPVMGGAKIVVDKGIGGGPWKICCGEDCITLLKNVGGRNGDAGDNTADGGGGNVIWFDEIDVLPAAGAAYAMELLSILINIIE